MNNNLAQNLLDFSKITQRRFSTICLQHNLSPTQARLLGNLVNGPKNMAELARNLHVEKAAITGLVDRAEKAGLVRRVAVPTDRRAINVELTSEGLDTGKTIHTEVLDTIQNSLSGISVEHLEILNSALLIVTAQLEDQHSRSPA